MRKAFFALTIICLVGLLGLGYLATTRQSIFGGKKKTVIRFWNVFTGPDGRTMLKIVKEFNRKNPDVRILMQRISAATYYNKLFVAGLGGRAPEVFVVHTDVLPRLLRSNALQPIDSLMQGPNGIDQTDLAENVWKAVESDGKHYALPLDCHMLGLYYNRKLFREAGIVDEQGNPKPPRNTEEFLDAAKRLTRDTNGDGEPDQWGYVFTWFRTNVYAVMRQYGGEFLAPDSLKCIMSNPANNEALQFCVDLIQKHKVAPEPQGFDAWIGFRQGKVGMAFEGIYMLSDLAKQTDLDFAGAPIPQFGKQMVTWAGSHNLCLRSNLDDEHQDAAWRFMKFLSDNSLDWAEGGQVPVRKSLRETERFRKMPVQYEFAKQLPYVQYLPCVTFSFEFAAEFDMAVEKALRGSASPKVALDDATKKVNEMLERQRARMAKADKAAIKDK